jgi:hypothetical protein
VDHRIAGKERGDRLVGRDQEREVGWRDDADHATRCVVHVALAVPEQVRLDLARRQDLGGALGVVAGDVCQHHHLVHQRFLTWLAGLAREQIDQLVRAIDDRIA